MLVYTQYHSFNAVIFRWGGKYYFFSAAFKVDVGIIKSFEFASRLNYDINI